MQTVIEGLLYDTEKATKYDRCPDRVDHTGDIAIRDEVVDLKLLLECRRTRDEMLHKYDALVQELRIRQDQLVSLQQENERLQELATQRGARMQIMWEWMRETRPSESYDRVSDQFLWDLSDGTYASWFDDDGVPVE